MDFYLHNSYIKMSMTETISEDANTLYLSIVGGNMVQKVDEGTPGSKRRDYEVGTWETKTVGTKFELHHKNLIGRISGLEFVDGNFGEQFILSLTNGEDNAKIHLNTSSKYFAAFAKKLPNIDLEKDITINSYDFQTKDGKQLTGTDIKQDGEKVEDNYWDGSKALNGIPEVSKADAKKFDSDDWKMHFMTVKKFLKKEVEKVVLPDTNETPLEINDVDDVFE